MIFIFFVFTLAPVYSLGTLHPLNRQSHSFCLMNKGAIQIRRNEDTVCTPLKVNIHKNDNNLIINFLNSNRVCHFICIDKCGNVYHDSVFHTMDCRLTTASFDNFDTLSVHRGNYSDYVAFTEYYLFPFSMSTGDKIERMYTNLALKYNDIIGQNETCPLMLSPSASTKSCADGVTRYNYEYNPRKNYNDYSVWQQILILFKYINYVIPKNTTHMSFIEYSK